MAKKRTLVFLGVPTLALSLSVTTTSAYLPPRLTEIGGPLLAGGFIAFEGVMALVVPGPVGRWSDRLGRRLPFVAVAGATAAAALVALAFLQGLVVIALALMIFYGTYFAYSTAYMALYPDLVEDEQSGQSQGYVGVWREVGLGVALVGGGLLLALWEPAPFLGAALIVAAITVVFVRRVDERAAGGDGDDQQAPDGNESGGAMRLLREHPALRNLLTANALWETALNALRAFVVLFFVDGLGRSPAFASAVLALVAVAALATAPLAGRLADRHGTLRVMQMGLWVYALGVFAPLLTQSPWVVAVVPVVAVGATVVLTLPYAVIMEQVGDEDHAAASGLFSTSRGAGLLLGPLLAGTAVILLDGVLEGTEGYAAIFGVAGVALLLSIPFVRRAQAAAV